MSEYTYITKYNLSENDTNLINSFLLECENLDKTLYDLNTDESCINNFCFFNDKLVGILTIFPETDETLTVYAIVHPLHRKQHIFTALLTLLKNSIKEYNSKINNLEFHITDNNSLTDIAINILKNKGYTYKYKEYLLKFNISDTNLLNIKKNIKTTTIPDIEYIEENGLEPYTNELLLFNEEEHIGGCLIYSENSSNTLHSTALFPKFSKATIFQFEVFEEYRGKGYGKSGLYAILSYLKEEGYSSVILHVSGNNKIAHNLYISCGFETESSLSIYQSKI